MFATIPALLIVLIGFSWGRAAADTKPLDPAEFVDAPQVSGRTLDTYRKGMKHFRDFLFRKDLRGLSRQAEKTRQWAQKDRSNARKAFEKCIKTDPDFTEAYHYLALVHWEAGDFEKVAKVAEGLLERVPDDRTALFLAASAFEAMGRIEQSEGYYARAIDTLSLEERESWESVDLLGRRKQTGPFATYYTGRLGHAAGSTHFKSTPPPSLPTRSDYLSIASDPSEVVQAFWNRFWKRQDPLLLTEWNERHAAHYGRVAFANVRFAPGAPGNAGRGLGKDTHRGRSWVKLGPYAKRSVSVGRTSASERWRYTNLYQDFNDHTGDDNPDTWTFGDHLFEVKPTLYRDPYASRKFRLPHQVASFQEGDGTRIEMSYAIPRSRLKGEDTYRIAEGIFVFDGRWDDVSTQIDTLQIALKGSGTTRQNREGHIVGHQAFRVPIGTHHLVIETHGLSSGQIGTFRTVSTARYSKALSLSDLLLAARIEPQRVPPESRDDLSIHPNPVRFYDRDTPLYVYLEIYNLVRDDFGRTRYKLSYEVGKPEEQLDPSLFAAIDAKSRQAIERELEAALVRTDEIERRITADYEGEQVNDLTYLLIDLRNLTPGIYRLVVEVEDRNANKTARSTAFFRVVD